MAMPPQNPNNRARRTRGNGRFIRGIDHPPVDKQVSKDKPGVRQT